MLFLVTQSHRAENCPIDSGGREALHADPNSVEGLKVSMAFAAYTDHVLYYLVEADNYDAIEKFLTPGFKR
jgi:hypothetical protein